MTAWWENEPVRFECVSGCVECCAKPGVVYFDADDIQRAARLLKTTPEQFREKYMEYEGGGHWRVDVSETVPCPFLMLPAQPGCRIHGAKPKQCSSYPFWKENLSSKNFWKLTGGLCPGIDRGPRIAPDTIREFLGKER